MIKARKKARQQSRVVAVAAAAARAAILLSTRTVSKDSFLKKSVHAHCALTLLPCRASKHCVQAILVVEDKLVCQCVYLHARPVVVDFYVALYPPGHRNEHGQ